MDELRNQIDKYLKGELTSSQMHELEMKALHDPFLAEALEGIETIDPAQFLNDVEALNEKIKAKARSRGKSFWPLSIAASLFLIISVTYLIFQSRPDDTAEQLALRKDSAPAPQEESKTSITDSSGESEPLNENLLSQRTEDLPVAEPVIKRKETESQPEKVVQETADVAIAKNEESAALEVKVLAEEVKQELGFSEDSDEVLIENLDDSKTEPLKARSMAPKKDATAPVTALSGAGADKRDSREQIMNSARPQNSEEEYQQYLNNNFKKPTDAIDTGAHGEIRVSFTIDVDGTLSDFSIEKGIGHGCDEALIKLIKDGPSWKPASLDGASIKEKATITFTVEP